MYNKLIIILGPTASGKSEMALKLAKKFNGEIVSADSRQIYKEMNIGTAKPYLNQKSLLRQGYGGQKKIKNKLKPILIQKIPHYLIDIAKPNQKFSVAEYKELAVKIIRDITSRGKIPILAGGTGLYISAIADNIEIPKVKPNLFLRKKLEKTPLSKLLARLKKSDLATFKTIDKNNKRRIIRALEVTISTGKPFSMQRKKGAPLFDCLQIGIDIPREKLYKKIDDRVEKMIKAGLVNETKSLAKKYSWRLPSMSGIGYREIGMYLRGEIPLKKAKELIKFATHSYARRQITWFTRQNFASQNLGGFRRHKRIQWIKNYKQTEELVCKFLT